MHEVVNELIDGLHRLRPEAAHIPERETLPQLSLLAHDAGEAGELAGHPLILLHDVIEGVGDFSGDASPVEWEPDAGFASLERRQRGQEGGQFADIHRGFVDQGHSILTDNEEWTSPSSGWTGEASGFSRSNSKCAGHRKPRPSSSGARR
jgi:hypothetical protein